MTLQRGNTRRVAKTVAMAAMLAAVAGATVPTAAVALPDHRATTAVTQSAATSVPAASNSAYTYLQFKKNSSNPSNSKLSFVYVHIVNDISHSTTVATWRAGSGQGSTNACKRNQGWLPNGTYKIKTFYKHHNGGLHGVNGLAWLLNDTTCSNGTPRTELFIHSEMKPDGTQGSAEPYRWDGNSDYKSNGCIKLKPSDIRRLKDLRSSYPLPKKLYVS
ncbi:L,D-transpeptidase family protein [Streptomyces sp. NPDC046909]|uniref:L,D-transpeptidase family protein n=1 Tax=Streptomyces sp. NPDC046909 TaxID=3155617 RepID=UPI0033E4E93B